MGMILDTGLTFEMHLKNIVQKRNKTLELVWELHPTLSKASLVIIDNSFIRSPLYYEDSIYDQTYNTSLHQNGNCSI